MQEDQIEFTEGESVESRDVILDSIADGVFTVDRDWRITSFNHAAEEITGVSRQEAIGQRCCDVFRASICESGCVLRQTMESGKPIVHRAVYIVDAAGERIPISISTALLKDGRGKVIGGVETFRDLTLVEELRKELSGRHTFADIISKNHEMKRLFQILPEIAESDSTVLIEGASGTGKEVFAKAIHNLSARKPGPLVTVNCGALPDTLLESELFGHKAGAFTDAKKDKPGRFALAEGGTIFLDEIGDVSPALQVRLLRVLQDKVFEPLGGVQPLKANVRVVTATNKNLAKLVKQGKFREDLFYRINVVRIVLPPLSKRKEDIPLLVDHFIARFNRMKAKDITGISPEALSVLMDHDFPGNVRELENIIEHAFVLCRGGLIFPRHLPEQIRPLGENDSEVSALTMDGLEARFLYNALQRNGWKKSETARELGIHPTTLWRKIRRLGLEIPKVRMGRPPRSRAE